MIWFRRLHKWIGLLIAVQVTLWMLSGFMMGLLDHDVVQGHHRQAHPQPAPLGAAGRLLEPTALMRRSNAANSGLASLQLRTLLGRPVYRLDSGDDVRLFDAASGGNVEITEDVARRIARADYSGEENVKDVTAVQAPTMEVRRHEGPAWRVDFDDADATSLYVSAADGSILERRNATWRLFDVFWMLHIMDYREREDFNNALVILAALVAAWFSVTGIVLLFDSFRKEDFLGWLPDSWWRTPATVSVRAPHGEVVARVDAAVGGRLYDELAKAGIVLPSNCGGGGTCGLCVVTMDPDTPQSAADRRLIPAYLRQSGVRLACQAEVAATTSVAVSDEVLAAKSLDAEVTKTRFLTPFIREITLRVPDGFDFEAGSYVHAVLPPHKISYEEIETTDEVRAILSSLGLASSASAAELRRAYSIATAPGERDREIVLNVRLITPPAHAKKAPLGVGSVYMWSLRAGDSLELVGPLGDFHARACDRRMIFIGGGAGMAPLRSIIRDELLSGDGHRPMDFWYGARRRRDLFYVEDLTALQEKHPNFRWHAVLSEPAADDEWTGDTGFVHIVAEQGILSRIDDPVMCDYYVCGPPAMLAATRSMLAKLGVPEDQVFFDDFGI